MDEMIQAFIGQIREALDICDQHSVSLDSEGIRNVVICGMGGSGIGGDFVKSWVAQESPYPIEVVKSYTIPAYVDQHTLAIVSSYSGNTEETVACLQQLMENNAQIVAVSSGGKILETAQAKGFPYIALPADWSSPRACLGYSVVAQMHILKAAEATQLSIRTAFESAAALLEQETEAINDKALQMAQLIVRNRPVIYSASDIEPVAVRWRQQLNENAKTLGWHHVYPELNHNELVGWRGDLQNVAVITLRRRNDPARVQQRMDVSKEIIFNSAGAYIEVIAKGKEPIEQCLYLVHMGDWLSWHLANIYGVDAVEVRAIDYLKSELAKIKS